MCVCVCRGGRGYCIVLRAIKFEGGGCITNSLFFIALAIVVEFQRYVLWATCT